MGDTLEYIEGDCEDWTEEVSCLLAEGYSREEALKIAGEPPLPDCWEFIVDVNVMVKDEEKRKTTFDRIGKRWRETLDKVKEYEIIEGEEEDYGELIPSITFGVDHQECQRAEKLKQRLLKKYKGKKLEDVGSSLFCMGKLIWVFAVSCG